MPQNRSILLLIQDLAQLTSYLGCPLPPPDPHTVRITMHHCCINLMQTSETQTQLSFIVRSDPKIALLPDSVRNWGAKQAIFSFMQAMKEQCRKFEGSEYERRMQKRPEFYNELRNRAARYSMEENRE
jgi:hypothetical protein